MVVFLGVLGMALALSLVYTQFSQTALREASVVSDKADPQARSASEAVRPASNSGSIEDMARDMEAETTADLSALDGEADGELGDMEAESESVNTLNTSYDENNF